MAPRVDEIGTKFEDQQLHAGAADEILMVDSGAVKDSRESFERKTAEARFLDVRAVEHHRNEGGFVRVLHVHTRFAMNDWTQRNALRREAVRNASEGLPERESAHLDFIQYVRF